MNEKAEKAMALFREGYNCSQAVLGAFCEEEGLDFETAMKLSSSFGGGMGRLREVCGAVSAMFMVAGLKYGYTSTTDKEAKDAHYQRIQALAEAFKDRRRTIICRDLLGDLAKEATHVSEARTPEYYNTRPCVRIIGEAAEILENYLRENP